MRSLVGYRAGARCALIIPQRDYLGPTMLLGPFLSGRERPGLRLSRGGERPGLTHEPLGLGGLGDQRLKPSYHRPLVGHNSVANSVPGLHNLRRGMELARPLALARPGDSSDASWGWVDGWWSITTCRVGNANLSPFERVIAFSSRSAKLPSGWITAATASFGRS